MPKKNADQQNKVEVENIRLSHDYKDRLVERYVREKFGKRTAEIETAISKELAVAHTLMFPEITGLTPEFCRKWIQDRGNCFRVKFPRLLGEYKKVKCSEYFPMPTHYSSYNGLQIENPSDELIALLNRQADTELEIEKFTENFKKVLQAVNTSKQLCQLIPELVPLFPKRIVGSEVGCTQLVPIDLINSVRDSLRIETEANEVQ